MINGCYIRVKAVPAIVHQMRQGHGEKLPGQGGGSISPSPLTTFRQNVPLPICKLYSHLQVRSSTILIGSVIMQLHTTMHHGPQHQEFELVMYKNSWLLHVSNLYTDNTRMCHWVTKALRFVTVQRDGCRGKNNTGVVFCHQANEALNR